MLQKLEKMRGAFNKSIDCFNHSKFNFTLQFDRMMEGVNKTCKESKEALTKCMQDDKDSMDTYCECFDVHF